MEFEFNIKSSQHLEKQAKEDFEAYLDRKLKEKEDNVKEKIMELIISLYESMHLIPNRIILKVEDYSVLKDGSVKVKMDNCIFEVTKSDL